MSSEDRSRLGQPESYASPHQRDPDVYRHSRMTSTVAQSFAADLDSMFGLDTSSSGGLNSLSQTVEQKKANVSSGQSELEKLEAKLRETEQRLAKVSRQSSPSRQADIGATRDSAPLSDPAERQPHPFSQRPTYPDDRPPTAARPETGRQDTQEMVAGMPGAMPKTPDEANGQDYVMVDSNQRQ